jgi:hypothetical protein
MDGRPFVQVLDLYGFLKAAHWMGNPAKGLIFKAWQASRACFPQSYPQFFGMTFKALENQQLRPDL